jgi:hypothetical protein
MKGLQTADLFMLAKKAIGSMAKIDQFTVIG